MKYSLRYQIPPSAPVEKIASGLSKFCKKNAVREVVLFVAAEEWNNGLLTGAELQKWQAMLETAKALLEKAGVEVSLNPWMTVLHTDRGRRMPDELRLDRMVSPVGTEAKACASFGDPKFICYISTLYRAFAEIGFRVLWIEDDFRLRNHAPLEWGGGFEDCILHRFAERVGHPVTRSEVVKNILRPGAPHPWRKSWMELWNDLLCETAASIAQAVKAGSGGKSIVGLMSSAPYFHSIEGRNWKRLFECLEIGGMVAHRPNFAPYEEVSTRFHTHSIQMLDLQKGLRKQHYEVAPEIENFPFTRWTKSHRQTWMEMVLAALSGSDGMLLDLFSFCGNGVEEDRDVADLLTRSRSTLEWAGRLFPRTLTSVGAEVVWKPEAARLVQTEEGRDMHELTVSPIETGDYLLKYGIPVSYRSTHRPAAVFGKTAWCVDSEELRILARRGLLIDGKAAAILCQRRLGGVIGLTQAQLVHREETNYAMEEFGESIAEVPEAFRMNCNLQPALARIEPSTEATAWTWILRADGTRFCPGSLGWQTPDGGRVVALAATAPGQLPASWQRQVHVWTMINFLEGAESSLARVGGGPNLFPMQFEGPEGGRLAVLNASPDPVRPVVTWPGNRPVETYLVRPLSAPVRKTARISFQEGKMQIKCLFDVPHMGFVVFVESSEGLPS